jgi:hypothetical protein
MKGISTNIVKDFGFKKSAAFQAALTDICGPVDSVSIAKDSFSITIHSNHQKQILLSIKSILDTDISVTLPNSFISSNNPNAIFIPNTKPDPKPFLFHGVIKVPLDIETEHIKEATKAEFLRRIFKRLNNALVPTVAVVFAFPHPLPKRIQVGLLSFLVHDYHPTPTLQHMPKIRTLIHHLPPIYPSLPKMFRIPHVHGMQQQQSAPIMPKLSPTPQRRLQRMPTLHPSKTDYHICY